METGTFRFAWTQGIGRWRWALAKLVLLAVAVAAAAGAFSVLFSWYNQPFSAAGYVIPFSTRVSTWPRSRSPPGRWPPSRSVSGRDAHPRAPAIAATLAVYAGPPSRPRRGCASTT